MELSLSFSPCPNDTFIFDALVNRKIDTEGLQFKVVMDDVEALNLAALNGTPDISKVSYALWPKLSPQYALLSAGGALGRKVGPLLITADPELKELSDDIPVALPGEHTTANLLFSYAFPDHWLKQFMRYDQIQEFVLSGKGAGVIIHENRFTYASMGLHLMVDLGFYWEKKTGHLIPLGGIVMKRSFPEALRSKIDQLIQRSISYNRQLYPALSEFITSNAQEMDEAVMRSHIDLYVNEFTESLGNRGEAAVRNLTSIYDSLYGTSSTNDPLY
jgi:1,4-dihydroxy-6-naphthoate synthase